MSASRLSPARLALLARLLRDEGTDPAAMPIGPVDWQGAAAPLSIGQEQLWVLHRLDPDSPAYNVHVALPFDAAVPDDVLEAAVHALAERHAVLRTVFAQEGARAVQRVQPGALIEVARTDLRGEAHEAQAAAFEAHNRAAAVAPFDLAAGPVMRAHVVRLDAQVALLLTLHHIVTDGWSMGVLQRELRALVAARLEGRPSPLPPLPVQYADFAAWQRAVASEAARRDALAYWTAQLADVAPLAIPTDRPRPALPSVAGALESCLVEGPAVIALYEIARRCGVTVPTVLLAALHLLLARAGGQDEVAVGLAVAGRDRAEVRPLVGYFVQLLAIRARLRGVASASALLRHVHATVADAYAHAAAPFELVVTQLALDRDLGRHPVFQVVFSALDAGTAELRVGAETGNQAGSAVQTTRFDLELHALLGDGRVRLGLAYRTDLFEAVTVRGFLAEYVALLEAMAAQPDAPLAELCPVSGAAREALLAQGRGQGPVFRRRRCRRPSPRSSPGSPTPSRSSTARRR